MRLNLRAGLWAASLFLFVTSAWAQSPTRFASDAIPPARLEQYCDLAVRWMQQYLQIDTSNPPGNEARAAAFFKKIFDEEGIENRVFEYAPGRANIWARLPGSGKERPIILLNHMDVVTSDPAHWRVPPFSGEIVAGSMYGRGAQDMKNEGLAQLMVMVVLKREKIRLDRDVIFLATADEEVNDTGTDWMIANQRPLLANAEYLITEGGDNPLENGRAKFIGVDAAEKTTFWLRVTARGEPGHGSRPLPDSAPNRLVRALNRIVSYKTEMKVLPVVEEFLREMAPFEPPWRARAFLNPREALQDATFRESVENDPALNYLFRDTITLTMLGGSQQTNVIPAEAWANLDVRILPGDEPGVLLQEIRRVVADPQVTVEPLNPGFAVANASPTNTALFAAIRKVAARYFPNAPVVPKLTSGYTENQRYRQVGIVSYGFCPYTATPEEGETEHGDNERIRVEELRRGYRVLYDVVTEIAAGSGSR
jgi:acetylornithine deacetylase/succinyl-diaminopimelate desuccinylase-like protein